MPMPLVSGVRARWSSLIHPWSSWHTTSEIPSKVSGRNNHINSNSQTCQRFKCRGFMTFLSLCSGIDILKFHGMHPTKPSPSFFPDSGSMWSKVTLKKHDIPSYFFFDHLCVFFFPFSILFVQNTKFAPISTFRFVSPRRSCRRPRAETTAPDRLTKKRTGEEYVVKYVVKNVGVNTRNFQLPALLLIVRDTV